MSLNVLEHRPEFLNPPASATLGDVCDLDNLAARIADGYIEVKSHRDGGLFILDYSRTTQFAQAWDHETMMCRGLMVTAGANGAIDADSLIAARGFVKFFTLDQYESLVTHNLATPVPTGETFDVYTKEDGSLGIAYLAHDGRPAISTRGSFHSIQADWATAYLRERPTLEAAVAKMLVDGTPVFEIISPLSRIVKTYDFDDLILLGLLERTTGDDLDVAGRWPGRVVTRHDGLGDFRTLTELAWPNEEGFVVKFASGLRVKLKFAEYIRLHSITTGMSTKKLWEHLAVTEARDAGIAASLAVIRLNVPRSFVDDLYARTGDPLTAILDHTPDEFDTWVANQIQALKSSATKRHRYYNDLYATLPTGVSRKDLATIIRTDVPADARDIMFALADGRDITANVWSEVRPPFAKAFALDLDS